MVKNAHEHFKSLLKEKSLRDHRINDQDANDLIGRIDTYANEITGDVGSAG